MLYHSVYFLLYFFFFVKNKSIFFFFFFFSSRRRHTRFSREWSSDVCSSDLGQVEHAAGQPGGGGRDHAGEYVAGLGDGGVGEQPLHVGLRDRDDRPAQHREDRHAPHHRPPVPRELTERDIEHAQQRAERADQRARRHQRRDWRRGALVDVRLPGLERHRADLEQQPYPEQRDAGEEQDRALRARPRRRGDRREPDRPGVPVQHGHAEQEERRRERAEQ